MKNHTPRDPGELRRQAESLARERAVRTPEEGKALSPEEIRKTLHELRVHQIELEMQNEELRAAQAEIEAGRTRYFDLYNLAPVGYCTLSEKGLIIEANLTAATLLGMARATLVQQPISRFILKEDQDIYYLHRKRLLETVEPQECDLRLAKPDGKLCWVHMAATAAQAEDSAPVCRMVLSDITERKQAEEELRRFKIISDNAVYGKAIADLQGNILYVNRFFANIHGYEPVELIGKHFSVFHSQEQMEAADRLIASMMREGHFAPTTVWHRHKDGTEFPMLMSGLLIKDNGNPQCFAASAIDMTAQHQAMANLAESENLLSLAQELAHIGSWKLDLTTNRLTWSDEVYRIFGCEPQEFAATYEAFLDCVHPEDRAAVDETYSRSLRKVTDSYESEHRIVRRNSGDVRHVHERCVHERDAAGVIIQSTGMVQDITERKQAEKRLRDSEQRNLAWIEHSPVCTKIVDLDFNLKFMSSAGVKGLNIDDVTPYYGKPYPFDFYPKSFKDRMTKNLELAKKTGEVITQEASVVDIDGNELWFHSTLVPVRDEEGKIDYIMVVSIDTTERKQAEEEIAKSASLLSATLESTADGLLVINTDGIRTLYNQRFIEMWHVPQDILKDNVDEAMLQYVVAQMTNPEDFLAKVRELYDTPEASSVDLLNLADGRVFERYSQPQRRDEKIIGRVWSFRDITERKRLDQERLELERQIQHTQKLESLGVLAGGIAHDFNNLLMSILGHADLALDELTPTSPARENIEQIGTASRRAADLCAQMLAYSGRGRFIIEAFDLSALIEEMAHLLKTSISKKAILNLQVEKNLPRVEGDATQIRQVVMNLVINASDAIGERSGVISVSTGACQCQAEDLQGAYFEENPAEGLYIFIEVTDTGCGMDQETLSRMFEPFFTTKFTGRGLGMSAVLGIVRGHRGILKVNSESGKGTTFRILLPPSATCDRDDSHEEKVPSSPHASNARILLVEDEESIRALGQKMLERIGFQVTTASDGRQALEVYGREGETIDLVMLDLTMPHMDGEETLRELKRIDPGVKIVMASGYSNHEIEARLAGQGLLGCIQKPYTMAQLKERLYPLFEK